MIKFFERYSEIQAIMSEKGDGSMRRFIKGSEKLDAENKKNRSKFFEKHGINPGAVIVPDQVHGSYVAEIAQGSDPILRDTDGLATNKKKIYLSITIADCLPVFFTIPSKAPRHPTWAIPMALSSGS